MAKPQIDRLVLERHNSIAKALESRLSCTKPSKYDWDLLTLQNLPVVGHLQIKIGKTGEILMYIHD